MKNTGKRRCPYCAGEIPAPAILCMHCGRDSRALQLARPPSGPKEGYYEVVRDGEKFAISFRGDIKVHGLDSTQLEKAQEIAAILNSFIENEKVG